MPASGFNRLKLIRARLNNNIYYHHMIHFVQNMPDSFGMCKRSESIPLTCLLIVDSDEVIHIHAIKKSSILHIQNASLLFDAFFLYT